MLVQVDGVEKLKKGVYLSDLADIMLTVGAVNALNLDGGGSTTAVYNGKVVSGSNREYLNFCFCL